MLNFYSNLRHDEPGRYPCKPVTYLQYGMDFRRPEYRREVFMRFYEFCLKYRIHAGASLPYMTLPYLWDKLKWSDEQALWYAFINGNTQHPLTSLVIFSRFPDLATLDIKALDTWYNKEWVRLEFDTDRRHQKRDFMKSVMVYKELMDYHGGQKKFFQQYLGKDQMANFQKLWNVVRDDFYSFGRMSTYSYLEYLKILGIPLEPNSLFLEDISGSKSLRNGLCKMLGRDDLDWFDENTTNFDGKYAAVLPWLVEEGEIILKEARERFKDRDFLEDVSYFTLESEFCTYKAFHRPKRRYPGVYCDIFHGRIKKAEGRWPEEDFSIFWRMRQDSLPKSLRLEDNPLDPGVRPEKQNHYRETGQIIMMDEEWSCFKNDFNDRLKSAQTVSA